LAGRSHKSRTSFFGWCDRSVLPFFVGLSGPSTHGNLRRSLPVAFLVGLLPRSDIIPVSRTELTSDLVSTYLVTATMSLEQIFGPLSFGWMSCHQTLGSLWGCIVSVPPLLGFFTLQVFPFPSLTLFSLPVILREPLGPPFFCGKASVPLPGRFFQSNQPCL